MNDLWQQHLATTQFHSQGGNMPAEQFSSPPIKRAENMAVVSNFDNRLHKLLNNRHVHIQLEYEKLAAGILKSSSDVSKSHIGDDEDADKGGSNGLGIDDWSAQHLF